MQENVIFSHFEFAFASLLETILKSWNPVVKTSSELAGGNFWLIQHLTILFPSNAAAGQLSFKCCKLLPLPSHFLLFWDFHCSAAAASQLPKKGAKLSISLIGQKGDRCVCFARTRSGQSWIFCGVRTHSPISSNVRNQLLKTSPAAPKKVKPHFLWYFATFFHYNLATDVKYESPHDWWRGCHQYFNLIKIREICLLVSTCDAKYNLSYISDARKIGKQIQKMQSSSSPNCIVRPERNKTKKRKKSFKKKSDPERDATFLFHRRRLLFPFVFFLIHCMVKIFYIWK